MRICVVGAGWYGCHISSTLKNLGIEVCLYDENKEIFSGASSRNQNRLHLGFHYARDASTRNQTREGFQKFQEAYGFCIEEIDNNIYAIPDIETQICAETYRTTMVSAGLFFDQIKPQDYGINGCSFGFKTKEKIINWRKAKQYFEQDLHSIITYSEKVTSITQNDTSVFVNGKKFDYMIDCTWGQLGKSKETFFEPCIILRYKVLDPPTNLAMTFVDGAFPSLYPEAMKEVVTLSSVVHTPLGQFHDWQSAVDIINDFTRSATEQKIKQMSAEIISFYPEFSKNYEYLETQFSIKTKLHHRSAKRECYTTRHGRIINVVSGKIDTIFFAQNQVLNYLAM